MKHMHCSATSARFVRATTSLIALWMALAAADLLVPVAKAQRETAPVGVTNYTRVDATVACGGATPVQALPELKKNGFVSVINFRTPQEAGANIDEAKATAAQVGLKYIHLPYQTPTTEIAEAFLKAVADPANQIIREHQALPIEGEHFDFPVNFCMESSLGRRFNDHWGRVAATIHPQSRSDPM
jgi:hypothetical protein